MYKHVIGLQRVRTNNDRAEKLVYVYVNSRSMKSVREHQRELVLAESKGTPMYALPNLLFDNTHQEPHVYGSLGHDNFTSIVLDTFDANDHVHELHDVMEGRGVPGDDDDTARKECVLSSPTSSTSHSAEQNEEGGIFSDDDMELHPAAQREIDLIMERQNKRARGQVEVGKECRTPPYPRAARGARAARVVSSSEGEEGGGDDAPIATLAARVGLQPAQSIPVHIGAYHPRFSALMPHQFQTRMMLNLHLGNAMQSLPSVPLEEWGGLGNTNTYNPVSRVIRSGII
jgi:hypothetical protein